MPTTEPATPAPPGPIRRALRRRRLPILATWIVGSLAFAAAVTLIIRPSYQARSLLRVNPSSANLYGIPTSDFQLDTFVQTQVNLITSPNILLAAAASPAAASAPSIRSAGDVVMDLQKLLKVRPIPGTYLIEVGMRSADPRESAAVVDAVVDAFMKANNEYYGGLNTTLIRNLEDYLAGLEKQSSELEGRWRDLASRGDIDGRVIIKEKMADGTTRAENAGMERFRRFERAAIDVEIERIQAEALAGDLREAAGGGPAGRPEAGGDPAAAEARARALRARQAALEAELGRYEIRASGRAADEVDVTRVREKLEALGAMQDTVRRRLEQLKFEARGEPRIVRVSRAIPPERPSPDARPWAMAAASLAMLPLALALFASVEVLAGPRPAPLEEWPDEA